MTIDSLSPNSRPSFPPLSDDLEHFRRRAAEERRAAALEFDQSRRGSHEFLAEKYEKLVELYERLDRGEQPSRG